ncbi:MAG TPA: NifU family protein [Acidimicrobiales bacterium]|nr:NifU family protein [Acidimicrobiales bacterium]
MSAPEPPGFPDAPDRVVAVTDQARLTVLELRAEESDAEALALWLEVNGSSGGEYTYDLYFEAAGDARPGDVVADYDGLELVVPAASVDALRGAILDVRDGGMVLVNPNRPRTGPSVMHEADLSSEVAQAVIRVLDEQVNPSIAAHGGMAQLVAVEEGVAYLRLGGGCVGCGLATVTLSQGIEVAIRDAVPAITSVVDVTDHASGTNPYYEPSKK